MAPAKKKASGGKVDVKALLKPLAASAVAALNDPAKRQKLLEQGRSVSAMSQRWWTERAGKADDAADRDEPKTGGRGALDRFGQKGLERRAERTRAAIAELADREPALGVELEPVVALLDGVERALIAAAAQPTIKRTKAHRAIDGVLDQVEQSVFDAALSSSSTRRDDSPTPSSDEDPGD
jgi:hypothetical protein